MDSFISFKTFFIYLCEQRILIQAHTATTAFIHRANQAAEAYWMSTVPWVSQVHLLPLEGGTYRPSMYGTDQAQIYLICQIDLQA